MPEPIPLIAALMEARITHLAIKVEGGGENTRIAEFDSRYRRGVDTCRTPGETHQTR